MASLRVELIVATRAPLWRQRAMMLGEFLSGRWPDHLTLESPLPSASM
jgi:hypothetical protein